MHFAETPEYLVEFVETSCVEGPYGARGLGEHGIVGIPAALANALSVAAGCELDELPVTPENLAGKNGRAGMIPFDFEYYRPDTVKKPSPCTGSWIRGQSARLVRRRQRTRQHGPRRNRHPAPLSTSKAFPSAGRWI